MSEFGKILKQASTRVMPSSPYGVNLSTINPENYTSQLGPNISGTFDYLNFARADAQTDWESAANFMGRSVGKALLSVPETAGFILDVPSWFGDKEDYNNMLSTWAREGKDKLDEVLPEYSKDVSENDFNPFSRGWWWRNGDSVVESLGYFVPALGVGKLVGGVLALGKEASLAARVARGMSKFSATATTAERVAQAGGVISSSIAANYAEGMQMAAAAYSETYKELLPKVGEQQAKQLASEAASKIVSANRIMLIPQIFESQIFFKSFDYIRRNKGIMQNWAMRNLPEVGKLMALEGGEELYQGIVEREAKRKALLDGGVISDDGSTLYDRTFDYLTSSEGLTEGFLGAIGGGLFGVVGGISNMKKTARDRKTALQAITENNAGIKNILNKQGKLLDVMNQAVDNNNPVAVENAIRNMFVNRAWLAAETGTFAQLEEYINSIENASQEEIEKNGWDRTTLGSKVTEFKNLLSKVEDVYNKVHSLGSNLSAEYKMMMGNHMMTQIASSENMQSSFSKFEELVNKHFLKREGRNNLSSVARADLYQALVTRDLAKATLEERKKQNKLDADLDSFLTSLITNSEEDINNLLKENDLSRSALKEVSSEEVLNAQAYKIMNEYLSNMIAHRKAVRDYNFYSERKNREDWEKQMEEAAKEENKTPVQESVPVEETKKETKKEVKDETIRQKEIETQNKVNEKTQDLIEEGKIFKESLTNVFKEFERDSDLPNSKLANNTGNAIEHPVDNSTTMKSIVMYKRKDGSTGFSLNMKGKTSKIDFDSEQKLLSHVKNLLEQEKQEREKAAKPVTQNKKVYSVPLTLDILENLPNGSTIQIESKTGNTIHFVKINDVIKFKGVSYVDTGDYYELMPSNESINKEIKNLTDVLNMPGIPDDYIGKGYVVVNELVSNSTQESDGKIVDEKLPEVKEALDEAPTIDNQVASSMRVWSEKEVNPPLFSEVRNRENELPGLSLTLQTVDSKTATLKDNSYDVDYLYSSNSVEDTSLQLEADMMWKPTDAFDYLEAPVVLVSTKRKEDIDSPVAGRLAHLQVIKMFDGEYDFNQESTSSSYEYWTVRQIKSKLSQTDKSDTNEIEALNKALSKARARVKDNIALRKSLFGEGKITAEQRKNTKPLPVNALSKTSGMIQTTSAYSPAINVFEANDAFGLGIPHTLGVLHFTGLGWGGLNEETGLPNVEATSFGVAPIQANAQAGSVYLLSQSNPGGTYIPIKLLAQTLTSLSEENQNKVVDKLFSLIEEFKKAGEINDVKKAQDEIRRIQNEISKLYQSTFSTSRRGHGTVVLDTGVMSIGKDKFRLGKYISLRKQVNGKLEEYRFYFFAKFGDRYGYLKPFNGQIRFNMQKYVDGQLVDQQSNVGREVFTKVLADIPFTVSSERLNRKGDFEPFVDFGTGAMDYNTFALTHLLKSNNTYIKKQNGEPLIVNGKKVMFANPQFRIDIPYQDSQIKPDTITTKAKKADIERRRQEELNQQTDAGYSTIALDYLFTGGRDVIQSTDYLLQALVGGFRSAANKINDIRNKYADKLGNLKDDINSDIYNQMMSEIRDVINKNYNNSKAIEIFDKILKNATGFTYRDGNQTSIELDKLNEQNESKINAKYDAELAALENEEGKEEKPKVVHSISIGPIKNEDVKPAETISANDIKVIDKFFEQELGNKEKIFKGVDDRKKFLSEQLIRYRLGEQISNPMLKKVLSDLDELSKKLPTLNKVVQRGPVVKRDTTAAKSWFAEKLPFVNLEVVNGLIDNGVGESFGQFKDAVVYLSDLSNGEAHERHEAFHAVMHMYLTPKKRARIYLEAEGKFGKPTKKEIKAFRAENANTEQYSDAEISNFVLEEKMADEFMSVEDTYLPNFIQRMFNAIKDFIRHILGKPAYMERLYQNIAGGKFTYKPLYSNATVTLNAIARPRNPYFTESQEAEVVNVLTGMLFETMDENPNLPLFSDENLTGYDTLLYNKIKNKVDEYRVKKAVENVTVFSDGYDSPQENWIRVKESYAQDGIYPGLFNRVIENLESKHNFKTKKGKIAFTDIEGLEKSYDTNFLSLNPDKTVSGLIKSKFMKMVSSEKSTLLDMPKYVDFKKTFPGYYRRLADNHTTIDSKIDALRELSELISSDVNLGKSLDALIVELEQTSGVELLRTQFFQTFNNYSHPQMRTEVTKTEDGYVYQNMNVSSRNFRKELIEMWKQNYYSKMEQSLLEISENTEDKQIEYNKRKRGEYLQKLGKFRDIVEKAKSVKDIIDGVDNIVDVLDDMGVTLGSRETTRDAIIHYINDGEVREHASNLRKTSNDVEIVKFMLTSPKLPFTIPMFIGSGGIIDSMKNGISPFAGETAGWWNNIGDLLSPFYIDKYDNIAFTIEGEKQWVINTPNQLAIFFSKLKDRTTAKETLDEFSYLKYSNWLSSMVQNGQVNMNNISKFDYSMHQGVVLGAEGIPYHNMNDIHRSLTSLSLFLDSYLSGSRDHNRFWVNLPFEADKTRHYILNVPYYRSRFESDKFIFNNTNPSFVAFMNTVKQEIELVSNLRQQFIEQFGIHDWKSEIPIEKIEEVRKNNPQFLVEPLIVTKKDGKYFPGNGLKFTFMTSLNELSSEQLTEESNLQNAAENYIKNSVNDFFTKIKNEGLISSVDKQTISDIISLDMYRESHEGNLSHMLVDFFVNYTIAQREIKVMLTGLDGEYKNVYDEGKRMAQYGAPVKTLYTEYINEQYGNLVMEDIEMNLSSEDKAIIAKKLGTDDLSFLDGITRNDAQGYCTINRYIEILRGSGRMPQEGSAEYAALQRIIEGNATFNDYNTFMTQPIKGFYYKRMFNPTLGRHLSYQVKYALVPLTKQFTEGTQLQKLKEKAEALERQSGVNLEIIPRSAFKVGTTNVTSIHNDNFELDEAKLNAIGSNDLVMLDNDAWGIQQDIPYHDLDYDQKLGTQIAKLILSNIDLQASYVVGGIPMVGAEIIEEFSNATIENLNSDLREVVKKFVSDDNIRKMLEETIEEDEKAHNLKGLLETRNSEFLLPLAFNISAREFMPLLKAKFNKVRDLTMPGSPFIQVSDAFLKRNTTDKLPTGIQWVDGHDGNLKMHMEGNTIHAEVVVSPTSMKYVVDGELDINKIQKECPEALEMIGYRIPTSSKSYSMVLKVVGFVNKAAFGDSIIVPPQLMKHMGFDFDVDKMFTLSKRFGLSDGTNVQNGEIVEKGKFFIYDSPDVKTGNRRYMNENRIFNVIKSIIQSPHHASEVIASGEFDRLEEAAKNYMLGIDTIDSNTYTGQRIMNERNMSAVTLKGIFANANGFLPIAQISNMTANTPYIVYIKKDGKSYALNTFGKFDNKFTNLDGELISSVAGEFVTAIMDAAKKPTTSLINVNLFTASTAYTMVSMGIPINDMAVFMQQPIIRRAYKIFNDTDGYFKPKSPFFSPIKEAKEELLENLTGSTYGYKLLNKYLEQAAHIKSKKDGVDVPIFQYDEDVNYEIDFDELQNHYSKTPITKVEKSEVVEWIAENYDYVVNQLKVINAYSNLSKLAANYTAANTVLSSDRNNDSHLNSIHRMTEARIKLLGTEKVPPVILTKDKNGDLYPGVESIFDEETPYSLGPAYWNIDEITLDLLTRKSRFFFNNIEFRNKYNDMKKDLSIFAEKQVDEDIYAKYVNALMAYVNSQNDILNSIDREYYMSERFIKDFFDAAEVAIKNGFNVFSEFRVSHEAIDKLRNSGIALITFEPSDKLDDTMIDEYSGQLAAIEDSEFEASDEDRAIIEKLYRDLVNYVFITTGFIPTKGSINRILPYETLLHDKYGIAENIRSKFETIDANTFVNDDFVELFVKHNAMNNKIVYDITRNMHNTSYADFKGDMKESVISSSNKNIIRFNKKTGELQSVKKYIVIKKVETKNGKTYTVPKLYKFVGLKEKKGIWIQIETRGAYGKSFEYFGNKTAYPLNNPAVGEETVYNAVKEVKGFIAMNGLNFENFEEQTENQEDTNENDVSLPDMKTYTGKITSLKPNQVFVFGSNTEGRHGLGSAKLAKDSFGAKYGQAEGLQGQSYGIITKDLTKTVHPSRTPEQIKEQIKKLYDFAKANPEKEFLIAYSGQGKNLNAYSSQQMADMFSTFEIPSNIVFEEEFSKLLTKTQPSSINIYAGTNENADLSNFAVRPFIYKGIKYNTVEGAFQAAKLDYTEKSQSYNDKKVTTEEYKQTFSNLSGNLAKQQGRKIKGLDTKTWDENSSRIMKEILLESFKQNPEALKRLLSTGNTTLTHTQDSGKWKTEFPRLLMEVRDELRNQSIEQPKGLQVAFKANELSWINVKDKLKGKSITQEQWEQLTKEEQNKILECL